MIQLSHWYAPCREKMHRGKMRLGELRQGKPFRGRMHQRKAFLPPNRLHLRVHHPRVHHPQLQELHKTCLGSTNYGCKGSVMRRVLVMNLIAVTWWRTSSLTTAHKLVRPLGVTQGSTDLSSPKSDATTPHATTAMEKNSGPTKIASSTLRSHSRTSVS